MVGKKSVWKRLDGVQILAIGFFITIIAGSILLALPISSADGTSTNLLDSIFTSTSAVCITGLVTLDTAAHWSVFGKIIIILLIEVGALGFMSFATIFAVISGKNITLKDRLLMQEALNTFSISGMVRMVKYIIGFTFYIQIIGAVILSTQFIPDFGILKGIGFSLFHSMSAFCNAGFDLFGNFSSLLTYNDNAVVLLTIAVLIIIGGLGFTVLLEITSFKKNKRFSLHTKMVLLISTILTIVGCILYFLLEYNNPDTFLNMNFKDKIVNSIFSSVSPRTAGFTTVDPDKTTNAGKLLTIILMFIGGNPGSTSGGLKTVTFGVIVLTVIAVIKGREDAEIFQRRIPKEIVFRCFAILVIETAILIFITIILSILEPNERMLDIIYETTSAIGTGGITTGVTQRLSSPGKVIIMLAMYLGRVGPLTFLFAITKRKKKAGIKYPKGKILIG